LRLNFVVFSIVEKICDNLEKSSAARILRGIFRIIFLSYLITPLPLVHTSFHEDAATQRDHIAGPDRFGAFVAPGTALHHKRAAYLCPFERLVEH
jgi:hypothetical protein